MQPLIFITNDVSPNYPAALFKNGFDYTFTDYDDADGMLIPGGGDVAPCLYGQTNACCRDVNIELDNFELFMSERFLLKNKPIMGICRGLQVLNVLFGGTLCRHFDGHYGDADTLIGCHFYGALNGIYGAYGYVCCRHHQKVEIPGKGLEILAVSHDRCIEAFTRKNVLAVQFHPERMPETCVSGDKIFMLFKSFFT